MNALTRFTGTTEDRALAVSRLTDEQLRRDAMRAANERDVAALWSLTEAYVVTKGRKKGKTSPATLEAYRRGVERLLKHWHGENLLRPSRDAGDRFVVELQSGLHGDRPLDAGTIQVRLAAARTLYKALRWASATTSTPFEDVAAPQHATAPEDRRTAYTEGEVEQLLHGATDQDAVIITLGADGGLRVSEMLALRWTDVNLAGARLTVRSGKGGKKRTVQLTADAVDALQAWKPSAPADYILTMRTATGVRYRLRRLCSLVGVEYRGVHAFRHYCGTWLYRDTRDLNQPRKHLGHADISTTTIYAKMDDSTLKEALARRRRLLEPAA